MIKSIENFLIIFYLFQQLKLTKMEFTRFAMKLFILSYTHFEKKWNESSNYVC